jgi:uncharacterized protein YndB with AHSA1/START domain
MKNVYAIEIEAPPGRVFYWLSDTVRAKRWVPNLVEGEDVEVRAEGVGSTFRHVYLEHGRRMEMHGEVTAFERDRHLASELRGPMFDLRVDYRLEDRGGRTLLTQQSEVRAKGVVMKLMMAVMQPFIRKSSLKQLEHSFARLKALAESDER